MVDVQGTAMTAALAHPMRHRITLALGPEGSTISELARRLGVNKGSIAHHLGVLVDAGLVRRSGTFTGRGGTRIRYEMVAREVSFEGNPEATRAMFAYAAERVLADKQHPHVDLRSLRLTREQARAAADHLDRFVAGLVPADARAATYNVLTTVVRVT